MAANLRQNTIDQQKNISNGVLAEYLNKFIEINMGKHTLAYPKYNMLIELFKCSGFYVGWSHKLLNVTIKCNTSNNL